MSQQEEKGMKPIWHFVGLLMVIVGIIILGSGIYYLSSPPKDPIVLHELHPDIWWGAIMTVFGIILLWINKGVTVE